MKNSLQLAKTHDHCASKNPKLTVVMIHGIASDSSTYHSALESFENNAALQDIRFVTFDLLGSGESLKDDNLNYDYHDQLSALHNSIKELDVKTPLVLVGHSLGTFIVTRYADTYKKEVNSLILISPPIYTEKDFNHPAFALGIETFKKAVSIKNINILQEKSFVNSMEKIVMDRKNYSVLANISSPTVLIYGDEDRFISSYNVPQLLEDNPKIYTIKTHGRHGVTKDKYTELEKILVGELYAKTI